jgi:hypothetical protein
MNRPKIVPAMARLDTTQRKPAKQARLRQQRQVKAWQRKRQENR